MVFRIPENICDNLLSLPFTEILSIKAIKPNAGGKKSFLEQNILIGGIPPKRIKDYNFTQILKHLKIEN